MVGQYRDGIYHISAWSHITNAHLVKGLSLSLNSGKGSEL